MPTTRMNGCKFGVALGAVLVLGAVSPALAHEAGGAVGGFASGFMHPIAGWDHLIAMVAVGAWASTLGAPAVRLLPLLFLLAMAAGGLLGMSGAMLPAVEAGIAVSAIVLGLLLAFASRLAPAVAGVLVAGFAVLHGHAHGTELPQAANALGYGAGFLLATGLLHLSGVGLGSLLRGGAGRLALRTAGGAVALAGAALLVGIA
jgi:urease accessory protein